MTESKSKTPYIKGTLYEIKVEDLQTDPNQPRKYFDSAALQDLVSSIKDKGVLQPVLFRLDQEGNLFIVAGERRLQAAKEAGLKTIPAILVEGKHEEIALVENLLREDLTAIELAEALDRIQIEYKYTQEEMTGIIGKAKSTVNDILTLNKLPKEIKDECRNDPSVSRQVLIDIVRKKKREKGMVTVFRKYKENEAKKEAKKRLKETLTKKPRAKKAILTKVTSKINKMQTYILNINVAPIEPKVREDLTKLIQELKETANVLLKNIQKVPYLPPAPKVKKKAAAKAKPKKETPKKKPAKTVTKSKAKKK